MAHHPLAGKPAPEHALIDLDRLLQAYFDETPNPESPLERIQFGTSGHRGTSLRKSFNRAHVLAMAQAVCDYRQRAGIRGPLFLGIDTHALSRPAFQTTLEVMAANGVDTFTQIGEGLTPTPVISHAILSYRRKHPDELADGIVLTPSHNPPRDGGFKYNPPHGGPAGTEITTWIEKRANDLLRDRNREVKAWTSERATRSPHLHPHDFISPYVQDLSEAIDMEAIRASGIRIGVDPMGGANLPFWEPIAETHGIHLEVVNPVVDPAFGFMCLDRDGEIRMDCSSPFAMAGLIGLKEKFDISFSTDPDSDRHGIVTRSAGLMNPNHYLAVAIDYLFRDRQRWKATASIGKTLVSSAMIDRVARRLNRRLVEVPVGFKWFVDGLLSGDLGFGGEESAGASFLRKDGTVWSTDKDGILLCLLSAEILAKTGKDPSVHYQRLVQEFGNPIYERLDAPADLQQRETLKNLSPEAVRNTKLAGEPILAKLTTAPGNGAPIGGLKVITENGWFAARPSGTEDIYKIYSESFKGIDHLRQIQSEAQGIIADALQASEKSTPGSTWRQARAR